MICLTGDLHHASLGTGNQRHCDISELRTAQRYLDLVERLGVKVTFFVSGLCCVEEWDDLRPIAASPAVELGGHNYDCFAPELWHRAWNKLTGSYNGPRWYQTWDALRTIDAVGDRTGRRIRSWRNHMYKHGPNTDEVLLGCGIRVCSDGSSKGATGPIWGRSGLVGLPINVIPDHEHLYHAERTPEWVAWWSRRYHWSDDWGPQSYEIDEWAAIVLKELRQNEERGVLSTLLLHPITMYLCDRLRAARRILEFAASCETLHVSEVYRRALAEKALR